ncbi:hypothetical protein ACQI4L_09195 [Mycolicibacterium litorale]|uniref:hypothetical protein n=1 Tax=Mycolicibacterium litorale TaxID=758802 RepID=UPI003CF3650B
MSGFVIAENATGVELDAEDQVPHPMSTNDDREDTTIAEASAALDAPVTIGEIIRIDADLQRIREAIARPGLYANEQQRQAHIEFLRTGEQPK